MLTRFVAFAARYPWRWFAAYFVVTALLYAFAIYAPLYPPFVVQATAIDDAIPLVPWTAVPYLTYFLLMPSFVVATRRHPLRGALLTAAALVVLGNLALNIALPTEVGDALTPAIAEQRGGLLLSFIVSTDTPRAAIPSGHLSLPLALTVLAFFTRLAVRWVYLPWAVLIGVAILTTKQHYVPDVLGAIVWGTLGPWFAWRVLSPRDRE